MSILQASILQGTNSLGKQRCNPVSLSDANTWPRGHINEDKSEFCVKEKMLYHEQFINE